MCESSVYLKKGGRETLLMEDVSVITPKEGGKLLIENILGEKKEIEAQFEIIDLMGHKIILK